MDSCYHHTWFFIFFFPIFIGHNNGAFFDCSLTRIRTGGGGCFEFAFFCVLCKIRTRRLQCRGRKGHIISLRKWPAPRRSIKQQAARLMLYNTQHSVPLFSSFFSHLFFSYLSTTHDIQESQHSSLSRSILSGTLKRPWTRCWPREKNAKRLPLFIRVTCSVVSVYPCANKK